ncbi:DUF1292 domain-containing protein [Cohnella sp. AR92]|uniref:DUF1292 domain-containing protein n=1 Tax=Cohnella sp. AR92 TaxID=648716 RepID=UPI000F8D28E6|nr:DUF1292 domain-containing protein [Cohnella sp. AR92]RUS48637.1 DUF1292 domain-containing protein [Cohnella sp. AR92]
MADEYNREEEAEIIYIPDEDGNDEAFEVIMKFEPDDGTNRKYMMIVPADDEDEEQEVLAFRYEEENDEIQLFPIEDQEEWDMVEETFNTLTAEFGDEDDR